MFVITPYTFQPLFQRFVTLWIYIQYVTDCMTVVFSYLCCGCCEPPPISLSTSCAAMVDLNDIGNDVKILPVSLNDVNMASGEPSGNADVIIDMTPPDLNTPYRTDLQNINELNNVDTSVTENKEEVRLEIPSCSRYCDHPLAEN